MHQSTVAVGRRRPIAVALAEKATHVNPVDAAIPAATRAETSRVMSCRAVAATDTAAATASKSVALPREREVLRGAAVRPRRLRVPRCGAAHPAPASSGALAGQVVRAAVTWCTSATNAAYAAGRTGVRGNRRRRPAPTAAAGTGRKTPRPATAATGSGYVCERRRAAILPSAGQVRARVACTACTHGNRIRAGAERET